MTSERGRVLGYVAAGLGMAALLVIGVFYVSAGLVAPLWAVIGLIVVWTALVIMGIRWFRRHPLRVLVLPVVAAVVWFAVITLGGQLLGWTA